MPHEAAWGAIFDWDGVVIDSSYSHEKSWELLAAEEGRTLPAAHFELGFGRKNEIIIPEILGWTSDPAEITRLSLRKEALYISALTLTREAVNFTRVKPGESLLFDVSR